MTWTAGPSISIPRETGYFGLLASGIKGFMTVPDGIIRVTGVSKAE